MYRFKSTKRLTSFIFILALLFTMPSLSKAADVNSVPDGAVINSQSINAFHESQVGLSLISLEILEAINAKKAVYFKLPGANIFVDVTTGNTVADSVIEKLPALKYTDDKGQVSIIPNDVQSSFEVTSIE